jgi:Ca2+-binding EF-hand superfamily protein
MLSDLLLQQTKTGQDLPGAAGASGGSQRSGPPPGPPPGPPASGGPSSQFAANTLSDLLSTQEGDQTSPFADFAAKLINQADTDGDGALSVDEIKASLGSGSTSPTDATDDLSAAVAKLDTDADGKLSASELGAGLAAKRPHHGHHAGHTPKSSADVASKLISQADSDRDGALGLDEVEAALGSDAGAADNLSASIKKLDADGDGRLSAADLSAALDAFRTANQRGPATGSTATSSAQAGMTV